MDKVRLGLIGVGNISRLHVRGCKESPKAELYALCDINEERLKQRMEEWNAKKSFTDYQELLADSNVDAVEVITPHHLHEPIGVAALEAGKHVSMQKPMANSVSQCDSLIEAAKRSGKSFRVFENFRYYPPLLRAKELIDSGEIGEPLSLRMKVVQGTMGKNWEIPFERWSWRFDPDRGGGGRVVFDYGYHLFSIAMWLLGEVEKVYSWITYRPIQHSWLLDSPVVAIWKYKNSEKYGSYEAVTSDDILVQGDYVPEDEWFEVTGSRGIIWVNRCTSRLIDRPPVVMYRDGITTNISDMETDWGISFIAGVNDFVESVIEDRQAPLTGEEGKVVLQFCKAIELSAKEGREVIVDDVK
jgi:predicted dehydrogenase